MAKKPMTSESPTARVIRPDAHFAGRVGKSLFVGQAKVGKLPTLTEEGITDKKAMTEEDVDG